MNLQHLKDKIEQRTARLGVIGLGYVGLPLGCLFAEAGFHVVGVDIKENRVQQINRCQLPMNGIEPGLSDLLTTVVTAKRFQATTNYDALQDRDIIFINVETPVDEYHTPQYQALRNVLRHLGPALPQHALIVVESTIAPGTMKQVVQPLLESSSGKLVNEDFWLGHCPERVMTGRLLTNLRNVSRVVGGMTPETAEVMVALYEWVVQADLDPTDCVTAELVKTAENAYRDVNIAFANEVALICQAVGGDVHQVRDLVNKSPGRNMLIPGAGVGGHCIPKDPWLLAYRATDQVPIRLIPAARDVNEHMPIHMAELFFEALAQVGVEPPQAKVLVLGYAYLENADDTRHSPSETLIDHLRGMGVEVVVHDPWVKEYQGDLLERAAGCHAVILMVKHQDYYDLDMIALKQMLQTPILIDGRNVFDSEQVQTLGFTYRGLGRAITLSDADLELFVQPSNKGQPSLEGQPSL